MPSWKKVITSGSNAILAQISASTVPTATTQNLLAIDSSTGGIMQISQSDALASNTFKATGQRDGNSAIIGSLTVSGSTGLIKISNDSIQGPVTVPGGLPSIVLNENGFEFNQNGQTGDGSATFRINSTNENVDFIADGKTVNNLLKVDAEESRVEIRNSLLVLGDGHISASGNITASNIQVTNDIALGGNIFSFSGFSFIEGVSANFSGSNVFGSGSSPGDNDIAGGGTAHQFTGSVAITGSALTLDEANLSLDNGNIIATNGSITLTNGAVTATNGTGSFGYLTAHEISSSGHLYAELPNDITTPIADGVVVYDTATGQLLYTASAAVGVTNFPDLNSIPDLLVSGAIALVESAQGEYDITVGGVTVSAAHAQAAMAAGNVVTDVTGGVTTSAANIGITIAGENPSHGAMDIIIEYYLID